MKRINQHRAKIACAAVAMLVVSLALPARAGWKGLINGLGVGWAGVNVRSSAGVTNTVTTFTNTASPSAAMAPTTGYKTNAPLPFGSATNTYARIKGLSGGIWQASLSSTNSGDGTDNCELECRVNILPADCASLAFDSIINQSQQQFESNGYSGTITVNAAATGGTALWLRGFEFTEGMENVPPDNQDTPENESIEYLKLHGLVKFDVLLIGPFEFGGANGVCPLIIPFTLPSGKLENLVFATDAVAKSNPLLLYCPTNVVVQCGQPVVYPQVSFSACGDVDISYDPPPGTVFPVGTTPVVVTLADKAGTKTNCTFTVTVQDATAPAPPALATLTGQCSVQVPTPNAIDICNSTTNTVSGTTSDPLTYANQGTFTVHWDFNDGKGNTSTANQTVIVRDTIPPVSPALPPVTGSCGAPVTLTPPTATDNCKGPVPGTTTTVFPITNLGTTVVTWRFDDGNGNITTTNQSVVISGLTFKGFSAPIGVLTNWCNVPIVVNQGSVLPIKFDILCGTTPVTGGTPPKVKIQLWQGCQFVSEPIDVDAVYQNDWHYNWDTSDWGKGVYRIVVALPDQTTRAVFVRLK